jgi:SOS response regulatory protein OraA/RecX
MDYPTARRYAFRLLSMRNYHSGVLGRKLESKGFSKEICEKVIEECKRLGFLKDDEFILREFRRGYGPRYIEFKLRVSRQKVRELISREMQREQILKMAKKLGSREKAMRALQRRGFDLDIVIEIFS